jgi:hypothetical protein
MKTLWVPKRAACYAVWAGFLMATLLPSPAASIHVAPGGNDSANGSPTTPLRSVPAAVSKARASERPVSIFLADGRYELEEPLKLGRPIPV